MGFEELAALKEQLSKRTRAEKAARGEVDPASASPTAVPEKAKAPGPAWNASGNGRGSARPARAADGARGPDAKRTDNSQRRGGASASAATDGPARQPAQGQPGQPGQPGRRTQGRPPRQNQPRRPDAPTADASPAEVRPAPNGERRRPQHDEARGRGEQRHRPQHAGRAATPPVDPVVVTIGLIQKRFPLAFPRNPAPKLPLKLGLSKDLAIHAEALGRSEQELLDAIKVWCQGSRYWAALTKDAPRVNLEGQPDGVVTAQQAGHARSLAAANRRAKRAAAQTPAAASAVAAEGATDGTAAATPEASTPEATSPVDLPPDSAVASVDETHAAAPVEGAESMPTGDAAVQHPAPSSEHGHAVQPQQAQ